MKTPTWYPIILVLWSVVLSTADDIYDNNLTKLWSLSSASKSDGSAVVNVTSASIVIQPTNYGDKSTFATRKTKDLKLSPDNYKYAFKSRSVPVREDEHPQVEKNVYYTRNNVNDKYNTEIPFPGNYLQISKLKGDVNPVKETPYNSLNNNAFRPRAIPLIWNSEFQGRSIDEDEEPILEKPEEFSEGTASKRSLSYVLGGDDEEDQEDEEDDEDSEYELEAINNKKQPLMQTSINKLKLKKKTKKVTKYMMPLLLAYKLKYFALVPVMIAGLLLLIGSTGLAGFFFALFAAVMALQKGGY